MGVTVQAPILVCSSGTFITQEVKHFDMRITPFPAFTSYHNANFMLLSTFVNTVKQRGHELMVKGEHSAIGGYFIFVCIAGFKGELDIIPTPPSLVDNYSQRPTRNR